MNTSTVMVSTAGRASGSSTRHSVNQLDGAVEPRRLDQRARDRAEERAHPERPERDRRADLRQDQRPVGVGQPEVAEVVVERHDHRLESGPSARAGTGRRAPARRGSASSRTRSRPGSTARSRPPPPRRRRSRSSAGRCRSGPRPTRRRSCRRAGRRSVPNVASPPGVLQRREHDADDRHQRDQREHAEQRVGQRLLAAVDHRAASRSANPVDAQHESTKMSAAMQTPIAAAEPTSPVSERAVVDLEGGHRRRVAGPPPVVM